MKKGKTYLHLTIVLSVLVAIILPLAMSSRPIDLDWFFYLMALGFTLVWAIYSIILLGYVFLVEGRRGRNKSNMRIEEDPFPPKLIQEWEALWKITIGRHKDPGMGNPDWN